MSRLVTLCEAGDLRVLDSQCRHHRSGPGRERGDEPTHLALLRRDCVTYHLGRRSYLGDPCTALRHDATGYRIAHPGDEGDDAMVIVLGLGLADELFGPGASQPRVLLLAPETQLLYARLRVALARRQDEGLGSEEQVLEMLQAVAGSRARTVRRPTGSAQGRPVSRVRELLGANHS